jgi:hypothetical protein
VERAVLNAPRWITAPKGGFHEVWYVVASEPRAGFGIWLRFAVDLVRDGTPAFSLWGSWFERDHPELSFALKNTLHSAAIGRRSSGASPEGTEGRSIEVPRFGAASLTAEGCSGEVEGGGHSLRWRLSFGQGPPGEEVIPGWLALVAKLRGSGLLLAHPATTVTGAVEVDGRMIDFQRVAAGQAHLWGRTHYPAWAWARCNAFAENPEASIDLLDVEGPAGVRVPIFTLRFRGETHRFADLPWIAQCSSAPASPSWHFSAKDARVAIDGVVRARPEQMVQVQYLDADGKVRHCCNTEIASMEVRVRARAFPGSPWRPEATFTSKYGACLEFCGRAADPRVRKVLVSADAPARSAQRQNEAPITGFVAS